MTKAQNMAKWIFPKFLVGEIRGVNDAGIVTFDVEYIKSLVREALQNAIDAALDANKPVEVDFHMYHIPSGNIPDVEKLKKYIAQALDYWRERGNKDAIELLEKACDELAKDEICILRISDRNTTGLCEKPNWDNMVESNGVCDKGEGAGGSYGIGKLANFGSSVIRAVIYATIASDGFAATEGVVRLPSYKTAEGLIYTGNGYFREEKGPIKTCEIFDPDYTRTEEGTDIYILCFKGTGEDTAAHMVAAVLEEYLASIFEEKLIVNVDDIRIDKANLGRLIEEYAEYLTNAGYYYEVLTDPESKKFEFDICGKSKATLHLLMKDNMNRKVMMCRESGLKIFDKGNYPSGIKFAGICVIREELNSYFRKMENYAHDKWDPVIYKEKRAEASRYKKELFEQIRAKIMELGMRPQEESISISGLGEFFPDILSGDIDGKSDTRAVINYLSEEGDIQVKTVSRSGKSKRIKQLTDVSSEEGENEFEMSRKKQVNSNETEDEPDNTQEDENIVEDENTVEHRETDPKPPKKKEPQFSNISKFKARIILTDKETHEYMLVMTPGMDLKESCVRLKMVGEDISRAVSVSEAFAETTSGIKLKSEGNKIFTGSLKKGSKTRVCFKLDNAFEVAMGVKLYGRI